MVAKTAIERHMTWFMVGGIYWLLKLFQLIYNSKFSADAWIYTYLENTWNFLETSY